MKNISQSFVVAMLAIALTSTTFAYEKVLPIGSRAALVSHAVLAAGKSGRIYGWLWAQGNLQSTNGPGYFQVEYNSPAPNKTEIQKIISSHELSYRVIDPTNDWLNMWTSCQDADGNELFYGGTGFRLQYGINGWQVPEESRMFDIILGYRIPIKIKGAIGARILVRDNDGNMRPNIWLNVSYDQESNIGTVGMISEYAGIGSRGQLIVTYWENVDGKMREVEVVYGLSGDGEAISTTDGSTSMKPMMSCIVSLTAPKAYILGIPSKNHIGTVPLGELLLTELSEVILYAQTTEGDSATSVRILDTTKFNAEWSPFEMPDGAPIVITLDPGLYHVDYDIPGLHSPVPYYNYGGGSNGGGGGVVTPSTSVPVEEK
ncbi:MAG: hypothetical protein WC735_01080 [Candidatus Paceibacterota bacterium]|jgi:hypothetical protein